MRSANELVVPAVPTRGRSSTAWRPRRSRRNFCYESLESDGESTQRQRPHRTKHARSSVDRRRASRSRRSEPIAATSRKQSKSKTPIANTHEPWNHRDELDLFVHRTKPSKDNTFHSTNTPSTSTTSINTPAIDNHFFNLLSAWPDHPVSDESSSEEEPMIYATKYYRRQDERPIMPKRLDSSTSSFDTLETQTEEETSTFSSFDEGSSSQTVTKTVRWADDTADACLDHTHIYTVQDACTVRIVILLLLNNGMECPPEENFEFLHCEYNAQDKLKVTDVLSQISLLIHADDRPFTRLFHQGLEMINAMAIQDFEYLQDGRSILVATRIGEQDIPVVLQQATVLLSDKLLLAELRKARIAGRSLQTLHSDASRPETISPNPSMELAAVGSFREIAS